MASVAAVNHKERVAKAYEAMEILGLSRQTITPILRNLLKIYNNEWDFIEAENYRALADNYFEQQEAQNSSRGPVTRARRAHSGSDAAENSEDSLLRSPARGPDRANPFPETPSSARTVIQGGIAGPETLSPSKAPNSPVRARICDAVPADLVARGMDYHSAASVRSRAAGQNGLAIGSRRGGDHNSGVVAAASERDKGKSPLVPGGENRRVPETRRQPPRSSKGDKGSANLVTVKLEINSSVPAPEGFEKIAFEKVDGVIIPAVKRPLNGEVASSKKPRQLAPLTCRVKLEDETLDPGNKLRAPAPLQAIDPSENIRIHVNTEPQEANASLPDQGCQGVQSELALEVNDHLQIVPYAAFDFVNGPPAVDQMSNSIAGPSIDQIPEAEGEEHSGIALPVDQPPDDKLEEDGENLIMSLVDYASEDEEPLEPIAQGTSEAGCDLALMTEESSEQVEPPELNGEGIRPNFIVCSTSKRDMGDAEDVVRPKRQKCEAETSASLPLTDRYLERAGNITTPPPSTTHSRRRVIISDSPGPGNVRTGDRGCTLPEIPGPVSKAGVKRKLIGSASTSPEGSGGARKDIVTNGDTHDERADHCEERVKVPPAARGQGMIISALKRVKLEPGVEDPHAQQLKHNPADISRGTEKVPIPFVNEFTSETINHKFNYIASNVVYQQAYINISMARIGDEDFCLDCVGDCLKAPHSCPCTRETGGEFAYTQEGLLKPAYIQYELNMNQDPEFKQKCMTYCHRAWDCPIERAKNDLEPDKCKGHYVRKFVKECWHKCGCSMLCGNRVVQRGISRQLQVFFTNDGKGWGIRTAKDLPAGTFVCEYVGEIMTNMELDQRNQEVKKPDSHGKTGVQKDTYPVLLDGDWCSERGLKDEEALCLDATRYGNVARFINHRCFDANLIDIPVTIEGLDRHYYHVAFFTNRDVEAWEELTWDYKIDFEDDEHPIEAFQCLCKSELCRGGRAAGSKKHKK